MQYAQKWLKTSPKNAINLTKIVHIAQRDGNRIRILRRVRTKREIWKERCRKFK